jgi:hypothetical protein
MVRSEGNMSLKNTVTPPAIDPGTGQLVAQLLNHYATPGPSVQNTISIFVVLRSRSKQTPGYCFLSAQCLLLPFPRQFTVIHHPTVSYAAWAVIKRIAQMVLQQ